MNHGIRPAVQADIPALTELWQVCFHDSFAYIRAFYEHNFERMCTLVYESGGKVVSMLHLMNACFVNGENTQEARFIYAVGTLPEQRENGYMGALLDYVKKLAKQNDFALFLKPSSTTLTAYYQKYGFMPDAYLHGVCIEAGEPVAAELSPLSAVAYNRMRNSAFADYAFAKWEDAHIRWAMTENAFFAGETLCVKWQGNAYFLLGYPEGDTLMVNETNLPHDILKQCSGALCTHFGTKKVYAYLPAFACEEGEQILSSAVYNTKIHHTYVNLILI